MTNPLKALTARYRAQNTPTTVAAIDLGSNSFHMVLARLDSGELQPIERLGEKVQLAAGLDADGQISTEAQQRGLDCLKRFAQRLRGLPASHVSIVGTNALRRATNAQDFISAAEQILGYDIEIIAGREEARLIYLGVAHTLADDSGKRLVIDIGGGSTEFIIGSRFEPEFLESLQMGCLSYSDAFFPQGKISPKRFSQAKYAAQLEVLNIREQYLACGWQSSVGSSGSIRAIDQVLGLSALSQDGITADGLMALEQRCIQAQHVDDINFNGLKPDRRPIFPAAVAILSGIFESLNIQQMHYSDGALREGLLYDTIGRDLHEDVRERTIGALQVRFHIDVKQAQRVCNTALGALSRVATSWQLEDERYHYLLRWAAEIHEIGLAISHSKFQKHGAYLLREADLFGFTRQMQTALSCLVLTHRRKFNDEIFAQLPATLQQPCKRLGVILRLAVLLHHDRSDKTLPEYQLHTTAEQITLAFPPGWLNEHPLTQADLKEEQKRLKIAGISLEFS